MIIRAFWVWVACVAWQVAVLVKYQDGYGYGTTDKKQTTFLLCQIIVKHFLKFLKRYDNDKAL